MWLSPKQEWVAQYTGDIEHFQLQKISGVSFQEFLEAHRRYPIIAITGQAGVGKTTFTKAFADRLWELLALEPTISPPKVKIVTELPQLSPYLPIIKATKDGLLDQGIWVDNQNLFLHTDKAVITKAALESQDTVIIMDFAFTQVQIYADLKIKGKEWSHFRREFDQSFKKLPKPDILIHISASSDTVLKRLEKRGAYIDDEIMKSVEILGDYYHNKGIIEDYYDGIPILTICMDDLDILANAEDEDRALQEGVDRVIKKVREIKE